MYRIRENRITPTYSTFKIQRRFFYIWFDIKVNEQYLCSLNEARKWIKLKNNGFSPERFYYE